ncbi:hypothetical protein PCASD_01107 [Puccinia coronata f. sp. avenae]|uniref:Uncharacterized protein n=1 Tax=Puccinia coronata f. sp. avenae TaxID=200324 RepID=A0A2N5VLZ3_9BASI|nr:hypothetical protein PCASD_01107 [Puccinia coronata f. sp. avenae]
MTRDDEHRRAFTEASAAPPKDGPAAHQPSASQGQPAGRLMSLALCSIAITRWGWPWWSSVLTSKASALPTVKSRLRRTSTATEPLLTASPPPLPPILPTESSGSNR